MKVEEVMLEDAEKLSLFQILLLVLYGMCNKCTVYCYFYPLPQNCYIANTEETNFKENRSKF